MTKRRTDEAGFTLLEIMAALAILAMAVYVLLDSQLTSVRFYVDTREAVEEQLLLQQAVGRAELQIQAGELAGEGDFGKRYDGYRYEFESSQMEGVAEDVPLFEVVVRLERPVGDDRELEFLFYDTRF